MANKILAQEEIVVAFESANHVLIVVNGAVKRIAKADFITALGLKTFKFMVSFPPSGLTSEAFPADINMQITRINATAGMGQIQYKKNAGGFVNVDSNTDLTPIAWNAGDTITFKTTTAGTLMVKGTEI